MDDMLLQRWPPPPATALLNACGNADTCHAM
jgi:hypothetical protein